VIGPPDATLADVAAAYEDLGDAHYQADEVGDHAAAWRAQQTLDATADRVAAREGVSRSQIQGQALAFAPGPRHQVTAVAEASPAGQVSVSSTVEAPAPEAGL